MKVYINENFYLWNGYKELTFAGVLYRFWEFYNDYDENVGISQGWNEETKKTYLGIYNECILPLLPNGKAMRLYTRSEFEAIIGQLKSNAKSKDSTNDHFEHLVKVVCKAAQEHLGIPNCWIDYNEDDARETEKARWLIQRSFTKAQEFEVCKLLMKKPEEIEGEYIGLLLMLFCLCRNGEAAALDWADLRSLDEHPEVYSVVIDKKTKNNTNVTEPWLKTQNGYRKNPLVDALRDFLLKYKVYIESLIESGDLVLPEGKTIEDLPIAHKGRNFLKRCSAGDLSRAGKQIFEMLGYRSQKLQEIHNEELFLLGNDISDEAIEKDPTTYILRRHGCTRLVGLDFTESEIDFVMGHSMNDDPETRDMFFNDDLQYEMYMKLKNHPLNKRSKELLEDLFS